MSDSDEETSNSSPAQSEEEDRTDLQTLREERDELEAQLEALEVERDELEERVKRTAADFENYKKRQAKKLDQAKATAVEQLLERFLDVRENLKRAIAEAEEEGDSLREGVKLTLAEFDRVLDAEKVREIDPDPGEPVDPERHEVMLRIEGEHPDGHIEEVYQSGYAMNGRVIRPAQVAVSEGEEAEDETTDR